MPDECFFLGQALVCRATNLCTTYRARQETVRIVIRLDFAILQGGETLRRARTRYRPPIDWRLVGNAHVRDNDQTKVPRPDPGRIGDFKGVRRHYGAEMLTNNSPGHVLRLFARHGVGAEARHVLCGEPPADR